MHHSNNAQKLWRAVVLIVGVYQFVMIRMIARSRAFEYSCLSRICMEANVCHRRSFTFSHSIFICVNIKRIIEGMQINDKYNISTALHRLPQTHFFLWHKICNKDLGKFLN